MRLTLAPLALILLIGSLGCSSTPRLTSLDKTIAENSPYHAVLAFDLRQDASPKAGLLIKIVSSQSSTIESRTVLLPFSSTLADGEPEIYPTWGSIQDCCTLVGFHTVPGLGGIYTVALSPIFDTPLKDSSELPGQLYFIRINQERRFVYRYMNGPREKRLAELRSAADITEPEAIAVALPRDAKRLFLNSNESEKPASMFTNDKASFFPSSTVGGAELLEIKYIVPLNPTQETALQFLKEFLAAVAVPIGALLLFAPRAEQKRVKWVVLILCGAVEFVGLSWVGWIAWNSWGQETLEASLSAGVLVLGLILTCTTAYVKRGASD